MKKSYYKPKKIKPKIVRQTPLDLLKTIEEMTELLIANPTSPHCAFWQGTIDSCHRRLPQVKADDIAYRTEKFNERIKAKSLGGMDVWLEWARSLYIIHDKVDGKIKLESKARDWKEEYVWYFEEMIDVLEKIEVLIGYKLWSRTRRDHQRVDIDKDFDKIERLMNEKSV